MKKETKSEYFVCKITPSLKRRLTERSAELDKEPADYVRGLIEKDCSGFDMTETEKPRMKEFAQILAKEFTENVERTIVPSIDKIAAGMKQDASLSCWTYRLLLYAFYSLGMRLKALGNFKVEDLKTIDDESIKNVNNSFQKFLDIATTRDAESIFEMLKRPM